MPANNSTDTPIVVNGSTLPATLSSAIRWLLGLGLTFAVGRGWISQENVEGVGAAIIAIGVALYGIYQTNKRQGQLIVTADAAPNNVAKVK